jgi:hypothetical protein
MALCSKAADLKISVADAAAVVQAIVAPLMLVAFVQASQEFSSQKRSEQLNTVLSVGARLAEEKSREARKKLWQGIVGSPNGPICNGCLELRNLEDVANQVCAEFDLIGYIYGKELADKQVLEDMWRDPARRNLILLKEYIKKDRNERGRKELWKFFVDFAEPSGQAPTDQPEKIHCIFCDKTIPDL